MINTSLDNAVYSSESTKRYLYKFRFLYLHKNFHNNYLLYSYLLAMKKCGSHLKNMFITQLDTHFKWYKKSKYLNYLKKCSL